MEKYRSGHNENDSKWSSKLSVSSTWKPSVYAGLSRFKKVNILLFCPIVLPSAFGGISGSTYTESCPSGRRCSTRNAVSRKASRVRIPNSPPSSSQAMYRLWRFFIKIIPRSRRCSSSPQKVCDFSGAPWNSKQAGLLDFSFLPKRAKRAFFQGRTGKNRDRTVGFQPDVLIFQGSKRRNFLFLFLSHSICSESLGHPAKTFRQP